MKFVVDSRKLAIILIGPPGSGKGTQAELLAEKLGLYYFETSRIIEENVMEAKKGDFVEIHGKRYSLAHERDLWKSGILCTPVVVSFWVKEKIRELAGQGKSLVLAGSPRTLLEGKEVMPLLEELFGKENIKIINIVLSPEESIWRNTHRRICPKCRHTIPYFEETKALQECPQCGAKLERREGLDDPESIKKRLVEYENRTKPLLEYFKERGLTVSKINGEQSIEEVFEDVLKKLKD